MMISFNKLIKRRVEFLLKNNESGYFYKTNGLWYSDSGFDFVFRLVSFSVLFNSFVNKPFIKLNYGSRICQGFDF